MRKPKKERQPSKYVEYYYSINYKYIINIDIN